MRAPADHRPRTDADLRTVDLNQRPYIALTAQLLRSPITGRQIGCFVVQSIFV